MIIPPKKPLLELHDTFEDEISFGEVLGTLSNNRVLRLGVDREAKISVDGGALRLAPLDQPGWGRQGVVYGPFERRCGLTFAAFMLNGHNNSQTFEPKPRNPRSTQPEEPADPMPWSKGSSIKAHFSPQTIKENLVVGWFDEAVPPNPLESGQGFVIRGNGKSNGELWANMRRGMNQLMAGLANNPVYFVALLRESGVAFYAGSIEGSRHLPALPKLRPIAIDPYGSVSDQLYAGIYQSILGEAGCRVDTRVYGMRVAEVPAWQRWYSTAHAADRQPQLGRKAAVGGTWQLSGSCLMLYPEAPSGLLHLRMTPGYNTEEASLLTPAPLRRTGKQRVPAVSSLYWRYRDQDNYLVLETCEIQRKRPRFSAEPQGQGNTLEARLRLRYQGQDHILATHRSTVKASQQPYWVHVLDDGEAIEVLLDGQPLFSEGLRENRLGEAKGLGLRGAIGDFEAHPRTVELPDQLDVGHPWAKRGEQTVFSQDFRRWYELPEPWERSLGQAKLLPVKEGIRLSGTQSERVVYTLPWQGGELADLEVDILPPPPHPSQGAHSQAGLCFWQDPQHYLIVNLALDDDLSATAAHLRFSGFESVYDHVWTKVPHLLQPGKPVHLRVVCDGERFQVYLNNEAVLYRGLSDIYPGAEHLQLKRVGLAISGYGADTGSVFQRFTANR